MPDAKSWKRYQHPGRRVIEASVRYFDRMSFRRSDDPSILLALVQHLENHADDVMSGRPGVYGDEPERADAGVLMFGSLGDRRLKELSRLGRPGIRPTSGSVRET